MALYLMLKATAVKTIKVRSFVKKDGTVIPAHTRTVKYDPTDKESIENKINDLIEGKEDHVNFGRPCKELVSCGIPDNDIVIRRSAVEKLIGEHDISIEIIKKLPAMLRDPKLVFRSFTVPDSFVVVTGENAKTKTGLEPVIVTISPKGKINRIAVNVVTSAYGRSNFNTTITDWIKMGLLLTSNKNATAYLTSRGLQSPKLVQGNNGGKSARPTNKKMIAQHTKNNSNSLRSQLKNIKGKLTKNFDLLSGVYQILLKAA